MSENEKRKNIEGTIFLFLFCLTVPTANWMIGHVGTQCVPQGPCLLPSRAAPDGPIGCTDDRCGLGVARPGAAAARRRIRHRRHSGGRGDFGKRLAARRWCWPRPWPS
ncbi:MAG: hypothetical protein WDN48_13750 [Pseudolabrys sp.]